MIHTPGPWVAKVEINGHGGWESPTQEITITHGKVLIAAYDTSSTEYPDDEANAANAKLIAAAPDLLKSLQEMLSTFGSTDGLSNRARAAISKAT